LTVACQEREIDEMRRVLVLTGERLQRVTDGVLLLAGGSRSARQS